METRACNLNPVQNELLGGFTLNLNFCFTLFKAYVYLIKHLRLRIIEQNITYCFQKVTNSDFL